MSSSSSRTRCRDKDLSFAKIKSRELIVGEAPLKSIRWGGDASTIAIDYLRMSCCYLLVQMIMSWASLFAIVSVPKLISLSNRKQATDWDQRGEMKTSLWMGGEFSTSVRSGISSQTDALSERKAQARCSPPTSSSWTRSSCLWSSDLEMRSSGSGLLRRSGGDAVNFTGGSRRKLHRRIEEQEIINFGFFFF